jgi:cellulose synthase operon protein B
LSRLLLSGTLLQGLIGPVWAQTASEDLPQNAAESTAIPKVATPTLAPGNPGQYVLEFSRSPIVGNRLRLESIYDETRLWFTRPRNWKTNSVKVQLRYRHSPALYASRSNLTLLVNGTSVGSVPLNQPEGKVSSVTFDVPTRLIQDYNELTVAALQNNSPTCTQDPYDPSLWSEILPDSKIVFNVQPQPVALNFDRYPYPLFDTLSLEANQVAYLLPEALDQNWLTATTRLNASLGQIAHYRPLDTRVVERSDQVKAAEKLVVIGTPAEQPQLADLDLPLTLKNNQWLDAQQQKLGDPVGVLMMTTTANGKVPVLVATGNTPAAVAKAVQFLVQAPDRQLATGNLILVNQVTEVASPSPRDWRGSIPAADQFQLKDLKTFNDQPYGDVSVRGSHAPALEFDFRRLPDEQLLPGSSMTLRYAYGPQINPLTSQVEVQLDGVPLGGERLTSVSGANDQSLRVELPPDVVKPNSKIQVNFRLDPRERRSCSRVTDQQLWGKIEAETEFNLQREQIARLPDLKLLQTGYPFNSPQDLSATTIVVPDQPSTHELDLLLAISERLGRLSQYDAVQLQVYPVKALPQVQREAEHLIAIGTQANFPLPEAYQAQNLALQTLMTRQRGNSQVQTLPDHEGVIKAMLSPWNTGRVLLALTSQTEAGLARVTDLINQDALFYQLEADTVLISANTETPSPHDDQDYTLEFLQQSPQRDVAAPGLSEQATRLLRNHWFVLAPGLVIAALLFYGIAQFYLKKFTGQES